MKSTENKAQLLFIWLMPTAIELTVYVMLSALTIFLCSQDLINTLLFATGDFNPIRAGVGSVDQLLTHVVGQRVAGSLSLAIFWGMVGLVVNLLWWVGSNFSTELNNDLVFSKYVHPKDTDPRSQLREFIERTVIRTSVAIVGIVYVNFALSQGFPRISARFAAITKDWSFRAQWKPLVFTILTEMFMLHVLVVLTRLVLLRKKVFDR